MFDANYFGLLAIPLWIGLPKTIKYFIKKFKEANSEPEPDFEKLDSILEGDVNPKDVRMFVKSLDNEKATKQYWFWETEGDFCYIYWFATLGTSILFVRLIIQWAMKIF